jgi:hypothetical protein
MTEVHELDALAAEYVLGTLDAPERAHSLLLLGSNDTFAAKVKEWERRLGELHLMVEPVEPEWQVWERVRAKIGGFESIPYFKPPAADMITPEPEPGQAAPEALPLPVPPESNPLEAKPLESASSEPGSQAPAAPAPESPEPAQVASVSPPPAAREPESEHFVPVPVLAASRERVPAAAGAVADADVTRWRRSVRQWQALALLMTLVALVLAGLVAALRDRLPPGLRLQFQATAAIPPGRTPRPPAPPVAQFDE